MPDTRAVIVGDAHLYHAQSTHTDRLFHHFLQQVPARGDHLVINGDLFEFWFEYRSVIPRRLFPTLVLLAQLRERGVTLTVTGGNHDRWGGSFWREQLGARFAPEGCELHLAGLAAKVMHGDGLAEHHLGARFLHWLTRRKITAGAFRAVHPDLGIWGVNKMSWLLGQSSRSPEVLAQAAEVQALWAREHLTQRPELQLLVLGHTHKAALEQVRPDQWYLNPGPWMDEARYAIVSPEGPELCVFDG